MGHMNVSPYSYVSSARTHSYGMARVESDTSPVASHGAEDDEILLSTLELVHRGNPWANEEFVDGFHGICWADFMEVHEAFWVVKTDDLMA